MTSQQCICIKRFLVVGLGVLSILAGVYLYINWIQMFTEMRGKVSEQCFLGEQKTYKDYRRIVKLGMEVVSQRVNTGDAGCLSYCH